MKNILVLGAGMVSRPLVRYLLEQANYHVRVASRTVSKAEALIGGHPQGEAVELNVKDERKLDEMVREADLAISLLPYVHHVMVAKLCLKHRKGLVTTSYVSPSMKELDREARDAGIIILNECGLDPGIDHMSAMRIIHDVQGRGGKITYFSSSCGALPSHGSNTNPLGYKFSWAPRGVVMAGMNPARFLKDGKIVNIPGPELFDHYELKTVPGVGVFENYPNRDSLPYADIYGIHGSDTVYRGTFRFTGWCETIRKVVELGYLDDTVRKDIKGKTYAGLLRGLVGGSGDIVEDLADCLDLPRNAAIIKRLLWLGLASDDRIPDNDNNYLDVVASRMLEMMPMEEGDVDMCILFHEFRAEFPQGHKEYITSTLADYGIPRGDTAIARTVALPAAIAARMILEGEIGEKGVHIPVRSDIYVPILNELERFGIHFTEKTYEK